MDFTLTFKPAHLSLLVPSGATPKETWVVCFAHRPTVTTNGIPALGGIDAWHPLWPMPGQDAAQQWAERFAAATLDPGEHAEWSWVPADFDDGREPLELYADMDDGTEQPCDIAIVPLSMLGQDGGPR